MKIFAKILVCAIKTKRFLVRSQMNDLEKMACPLWQSRNDVHVRITTRTQCWLLGQLWRWKFDGFPPDLKKQLNKIKYLGVNSCPILIILINIIIGWYELRKAKVPCPRYRWWRGQANFRFAIKISLFFSIWSFIGKKKRISTQKRAENLFLSLSASNKLDSASYRPKMHDCEYRLRIS